MDETFQAILDSLPPKPSRSKLEPYTELIQELRTRGRSYREITNILGDRCGVKVGVHTVYNFVHVRVASATKKTTKARETAPAKKAVLFTRSTPPTPGSENGDPEVWRRIQALKDKPGPAHTHSAEKVFHYDENLPLTVTRPKNED